MRVPGSAGMRVHETIPQSWASEPARVATLQLICQARPDSVDLWPGAAVELEKAGWKKEAAGTKFSGPLCGSVSDMEDVIRHKDLLTYATISVSCRGDVKTSLGSALQLAGMATDAGFLVRAYVRDAFEEDPAIVQDVVVGLADADTSTIILSDASQQADVDAFREVIEAALWVDVVGESMLERLGLRVPLPLCVEAIKLGITRFDACHDLQSASRRRGTPFMMPVRAQV